MVKPLPSTKKNKRWLGILGLVLFVGALSFTLSRPSMKPPETNMDTPTPLAASRPAQGQSPSVQPQTVVLTRMGSFHGTGHMGSGGVTVTTIDGKSTIKLEDNFYVTPGPDLYVGFGNNDKVDRNALIGTLSSNEGQGSYAVPADVNVANYSQVIIYCKAYGYEFSVATLN